MSINPEGIRAESHSEIGIILQRDTAILIERWSHRAVEEQPGAQRLHHDALLDHLHAFLLSLGRSLTETEAAMNNGHCLTATAHGEQRWEVGWSLPEVIRDYQILRLVILDYLEATLERPLGYREVMAIGLALDEAITVSVVTYARSRDEYQRQSEESRAQLERRIQEGLRQQADALRESDRRKNEFLAILAHELRNPLAPLQHAVGVLYVQAATDPTMTRIRDVLDRQVRLMGRLLDDLLDVSRIAQGKVALEKQWIGIAAVVSQAVQVSEPLLKSRQLALEVVKPDQELWLEADPARLVQVIVNLLNNAAKYTDRGGRVRLTVESHEAEAVIRVQDTGLGIAPELLPHVFDLFTQAEWPIDRSQGGLGIGLALVRRLVELHDGRIAAFSPGLGQGSEFVVRLPASSPLPPTAISSLSQTPVQEAAGQAIALRRRISVVEDNSDSAETLAMLLRLRGHEVHVAHDGPTALASAEQFNPEVVLLDIGLPRMDGYEVARRLRAQPWGREAVLVALTGYGQDDDRQRSRDAGFDAHLVKPVDLEALDRILATCRTGPAKA